MSLCFSPGSAWRITKAARGSRGDRSVGLVAKDFDLTETAVREWVEQAGRDGGTRRDGGLTTDGRHLRQIGGAIEEQAATTASRH